jgi:cell division transport system permease protein
MLRRRTDLPRERDEVSRFLPWLVAFMVFLAALALAGALVLSGVVARGDRGVSGTLTVQVPPAGTAEETERRTAAILDVVRRLPEAEAARALDEARLLELLSPWLGSAGQAGDLPLPRLIDVELKPGARVDVRGLADRLAAVAPGATVDDHRVWLERLVRLLRAVQGVAGSILGLIGIATVGMVVFATRAAIAVHRELIEVLHLIGARDSYIARQFARRALGLALKGGILGLVLAVPTIIGLGILSRRLQAGLMSELSLTPWHWAAIVALPLAAAAVATATARATVMRWLARML